MPVESPGLLLTVFAFVVTIGLLVFVHEMGHYLVGRWCGVKADRFSIGFGREIAGWTDRRGTRWAVGILPLGGYVQFAGDADATSRPMTDAEAREAGVEPDRSKWFSTKPLWKRALVVLAGPVTNFLLAIIILAGFAFAYGESVTPARVSQVIPQSAAAKMGVQAGDVIVEMDGRKIDTFDDVAKVAVLRPGKPIELVVERGGSRVAMDGTIGIRTVKDRFGTDHHLGMLGIEVRGREYRDVSLLEAPVVATRETFKLVGFIADTIGQIVGGNISAKELGGPLKIAQVSGEQMNAGAESFVLFVALISINLGFINLLPIPMLDGGHLLLYAIEAIRGRPASLKAQEWAFRAGFAMVIAFMAFVTFNDLSSFGLFRH